MQAGSKFGLMRLRSRVAKALATALAAVVPAVLATAAPASAQQANPKPTSCAGVAFTDPAGDATTTPTTTRDNLDLGAGFLRYVTNASGENVLTANIQVTDLDKRVEAGASANIWEFRWTSGGTGQYVRLELHSDGRVFFYYGTYAGGADPFKGDLTTFRGDTTGRMFLGKDGIVEIVIPVAELKLGGKRLTNPHAVSKVWYTDHLLNTYSIDADSAPDSQTGGKAFDVVPCAKAHTLSLTLSYRPGRTASGRSCALGGVRARLGGPDVDLVERVDFLRDGHRVAKDESAPFSKRIHPANRRREHSHEFTARAHLKDGSLVTKRRVLRVCRRSS